MEHGVVAAEWKDEVFGALAKHMSHRQGTASTNYISKLSLGFILHKYALAAHLSIPRICENNLTTNKYASGVNAGPPHTQRPPFGEKATGEDGSHPHTSHL